jgi:hypothetical protein
MFCDNVSKISFVQLFVLIYAEILLKLVFKREENVRSVRESEKQSMVEVLFDLLINEIFEIFFEADRKVKLFGEFLQGTL